MIGLSGEYKVVFRGMHCGDGHEPASTGYRTVRD
jgi:hypothetical protein